MSIAKSIARAIIKTHRKRLAREIFANHQGIIQRGSFEGMKLDGEANTSAAAHGLKILGLYETPVMDQMRTWCPAEVLVDIGAADGYYPIGMLKAGLVERANCFEMTEAGRAAIARNAELNGVSDRIKILGKADSDLPQVMEELNIPKEKTIILCDIEGAEFSLIDRALIEQLSGARIVIELHEPFVDGDDKKLREDLLAQFPDSYQTSILVDSPRSWNGIPELEEMHDLDRALVTSEGRKFIGEWLVAQPTG